MYEKAENLNSDLMIVLSLIIKRAKQSFTDDKICFFNLFVKIKLKLKFLIANKINSFILLSNETSLIKLTMTPFLRVIHFVLKASTFKT